MESFIPERVAHPALSQQVVAAVRRAIILGELAPGLHLEEPTLADKFGVSRIPVREALGRLAHEGLVRLEPRRGAFVVGADEEDIRDIYEFRLLLETTAVHKATPRLGAEDYADLQTAIDQMRAAVRAGHLHLIGEPDVAFHQGLIVAAGSRRLLAAWQQTVGLIGTLLSIADSTHRDMSASVESHQAILDALIGGDAATAEELLRHHLLNGVEVMCRAMRAARAARASAAGLSDAAAG